jgi:hypothetical protein
MSEITPQIIPLGSLSEAAIAGAEVAQEEQQGLTAEGPGTLTGYIAP